jgi:hypothetical protein
MIVPSVSVVVVLSMSTIVGGIKMSQVILIKLYYMRYVPELWCIEKRGH